MLNTNITWQEAWVRFEVINVSKGKVFPLQPRLLPRGWLEE